MSERNKSAWLTPEALRSGLTEQYAIERFPFTHEVTLAWLGPEACCQWVVKRVKRDRKRRVIEAVEQHYDLLREARKAWQEQVAQTRV